MNEISAQALPNVSRPINVTVPAEVAYNLDKTQAVLKNVLGKLGCPGCTSGFDIRFIVERDFIVNPKTLEIVNARQF